MITFRREYLDFELEKELPRMKGRVLDVGGRKNKKRGRFRPPLGQVESWHYANPDAAAEPDFQAPAESLPVPNDAYDLVVMTEVLEYVADPAKALAEVHRVLKAGSAALISVPLLTPVHGDWEFDKFRFTRSGLEVLLKKAGFANPEIREMGGAGAVMFDLFEAATGYAHPDHQSISLKIARKALYWCAPAFELVDRLFKATRPYVTTGYFIVARK